MAVPRLSDALYILWEFVTKWLVAGGGGGVCTRMKRNKNSPQNN